MSKEAMDARQAHEPPTNWLHNILGLQEDVRPLFQADNEVAEIHGKVVPGVRSVDESRAKDIQNTRESLRALSRRAEAYKHATRRPANAPTAQQHEAKLVELDTKKFGIVKTIADLEQAITGADLSVGRLKQDVAALDAQDPLSSSQGPFSEALKIQVIRSLGFIPMSYGGQYERLLVKSDIRQDVHAYDIDASPSRFDLANKAWQAATPNQTSG